MTFLPEMKDMSSVAQMDGFMSSTSSLRTLPSDPSDDLAIYPVEDAPRERTLLDILETTTANNPDALAIDNTTSRLTYRELSVRIAAKVAEFRAAGIVTGDRIGIRVTSGTLDLYVGILAIITAGCSYVPVDVDDPNERAELVFSEAHVAAILGTQGLVVQNLTPLSSVTGDPHRRPTPDDDAWIIFTSGSTGKPKGVAVTHRSAAAFVDAESRKFLQSAPLGPKDRVLAGLSVAFDASCEEMWLAWRYGGCLVPAPRSLVKAGADLGNFLTAQKITAVSTVPTLAALWPAATLQNIRLLILGGEAFPPGLKDRLCSVCNEVWNTYGPTEATVVACGEKSEVGRPVSIGLPLAGWKLAVVGEDGKAVRWGEEGELVIGGVGMARYLDPAKDAIKYAPAEVFNFERAYRSGDLVRAEKDGLYFVGRNDEQIKLGGRRIELGEIDTAMINLPGIKGAAAAIRKSETGNSILVGYIVRDPSATPDPNEREILKNSLPPSLVPLLVEVDDLPVRTSGKVDRKALPWPPPPSASSLANNAAFQGDELLAWMAETWQKVLGVPATLPSSFFDLGGTSLGAAQLVSMLRDKCPTMSIADVYEHPTLGDMTAHMKELMGTKQCVREVKPTPWYIFPIQTAILIAIWTFSTLRLLATFALLKKSYEIQLGKNSWAGKHAIPAWTTGIFFAAMATFIGRTLVAALFIRIILIGGIRPGIYDRGSFTHLRVWAADRLLAISGIGGIPGTPWARRFAWLLGCKVGRDCHIGFAPVTGLASFGDGCSLASEVDTAGHWLDGDKFIVGTITIGDYATVGSRCHIMPNTRIDAGAVVGAGMSVQGRIRCAPGDEPLESEKDTLKDKGWFTDLRYTVFLLWLDALPLIPIGTVYGLTASVVRNFGDFNKLVIALIEFSLPGALVGIGIYFACVVVSVRFASIWIRPGNFSWHSGTAWAAWATTITLHEARANMFCLYASLATPNWMRLLGAKVGRNVEISNIITIPKLLWVQDNAFLADDVLIAPVSSRAGRVWLGRTTVGSKAFVGNSGIVEPGVNIPENSLVGTTSTAPHNMTPGSSFLGRPPISLPRKVDENLLNHDKTYKPSKLLKFCRGFCEIMRLVPTVINGAYVTFTGVACWWFWDQVGLPWTILFIGALGMAIGLSAVIITVLVKWILTPKTPVTSPLWSSFVWRNEIVDTFIQSLAVPTFLENVEGTEWMAIWFRCMGAKVGRGTWIESHFFPEAEMCFIGSGVTVNRGAVAQTHLFHDRLMRLHGVSLGNGATLGPRAICLPGSTIGIGTTIGPMSLVMAGENIPDNTRWRGNPVRPWSLEPEEEGLMEAEDEKEKDDSSSSNHGDHEV